MRRVDLGVFYSPDGPTTLRSSSNQEIRTTREVDRGKRETETRTPQTPST